MSVVQRKLSKTFTNFFDSEKSSGILLIICTIVSLNNHQFDIGRELFNIVAVENRWFERRALDKRRADGDFLFADRSGTQTRT